MLDLGAHSTMLWLIWPSRDHFLQAGNFRKVASQEIYKAGLDSSLLGGKLYGPDTAVCLGGF
jgi:hypothetical protein|eukprot:COSAG01_NODE_164_length_23340_cov_76.030033_3_plen_62_part_00